MRQYFKGYYFKCRAKDETVAIIPAFHNDGIESSASLQIITNDNAYFIPYSEIRFQEDQLKVGIGPNYFTEKGIYLDVDSEGCRIHGKLRFGKFQKIKYDIMGPFQYIPFMECKHSIISMRHSVNGKISINGKVYNFNQGIGYIEGDRGCSFPKEYIWTQCHCKNGSIMLSVADIPLLGFHFKGIIGIILVAGQEIRVATYLGAKVVSVSDDTVVIKQGKYTISAKLLETSNQKLNAPVNGKMSRMIHESASCSARYQLICNDNTLLEFTSQNASFEFEMQKQ